MSQIVVRMDPADKLWWQQEAARKNIGFSELVRQVLADKKQQAQKKKKGRTMGEVMKEFRAQHPELATADVPKDLSTNYKQYLYGTDFR
ncbi:MAG: hypothetical protein H6774_02750 [Pseudomonadales bacterium]|nr:hypothetical protein [Candidatus Woesebacteria bacterium]MCB9801984.1 hypothetical protein [Pseudomonadales bacterium]